MGVGGAFIFPTTLSILTNTFSARSGHAIGIWAGVAGARHRDRTARWWAAARALLVGIGVPRQRPLTLTAILLGLLYVPDSRDPDEARSTPSALLSIVTLRTDHVRDHRSPDLGWGDRR
jgi:hypothetical protein